MLKKRIATGFSIYHVKFIIRLSLFIWALIAFIMSKGTADIVTSDPILFAVIWVLCITELIVKLFPSKLEGMGSQKQFKGNYLPNPKSPVKITAPYPLRAAFVAVVWILVNGIFIFLYHLNIFNTGVMMLLFLFYAVGDMICVLFYCPFQELMRNRCCSTCRIHNWDSPMMCTPLILIPNPFTFSLFVLSLIVLIQWELCVHKHPERFNEKSNLNLSCNNCPETYCTRRGKVFKKHDILGSVKTLIKK